MKTLQTETLYIVEQNMLESNPISMDPLHGTFEEGSTINRNTQIAHELQHFKEAVITNNTPTVRLNIWPIPPPSATNSKGKIMQARQNPPRVATVLPIVSQQMTNKCRLRMHWKSYLVSNYINITRYFQCQRFGHPSKYCESVTLCRFCSSTEHTSSECNVKEDTWIHAVRAHAEHTWTN